MTPFFTLSSILILATLAFAAPQPQVTPAAALDARSLVDTGLRVGGATIYLTLDPIGELKSVADAGEDVTSYASSRASEQLSQQLASIEFVSSFDAQETSSYMQEGYSLYSELASIATETDSAVYQSKGAAATASIVSSLSAAIAKVTSVDSVDTDSAAHFSIPNFLPLSFILIAGAWVVLV